MPNPSLTRHMIFNIFLLRSPWQIKKKGSPLIRRYWPNLLGLHWITLHAISLSKRTNNVDVEGPQSDLRDIVRCGTLLHWSNLTEWIFHNWRSFDAARNLANQQRLSEIQVCHHLILMHSRICHCIETAHSNLISSTTLNKIKKDYYVLACRKVHSVCCNFVRLKYC